MRDVLSFLAGSYDFVEDGGQGMRRVFTWRRENATEATVSEGAKFVCPLTFLEGHRRNFVPITALSIILETATITWTIYRKSVVTVGTLGCVVNISYRVNGPNIDKMI
jgi:hypothetical protein